MSERASLLGNAGERERRKAALDGVERGDATSERLEQSARAAGESAETGEEILRNLQEQRDKILSARASAGHMERDMDRSERKMYQLGCEKCMQRWAFCVLVLLVLGGLSFFLYWKLQHQKDGDDDDDDEDVLRGEEAVLGRRFMDERVASVGTFSATPDDDKQAYRVAAPRYDDVVFVNDDDDDESHAFATATKAAFRGVARRLLAHF